MRLDANVDRPTTYLAGIQVRVDNPAQALEKVADLIRDRNRRMFNTGGFGSWAPKSARSLLTSGDPRPLVDTGNLMNSLTRSTSRDADHRVTSDSVSVESKSVAGIMAQRGSRGAPKRNPSPPPTRADLDKWAGVLLAGFLGMR